MVSPPPPRVRVVPLDTVTALVSPMLAPPITLRLPADRLMAPEWVLVPDSVSVPSPALLSAPVPDNTPDKVTALPLKIVASPAIAMALETVTPLPVIVNILPPASVAVPVPRLLPLLIDTPLAPRMSVPPE